MAMWHCPHCGAPQAETARCWVCRRSSTTCSTCRNFRGSLAADVGYCSLDARRRPLTGLELRGCWAGRPATADAPDSRSPITLLPRPAGRRGFVPVEDLVVPAITDAAPIELARAEPRDAPTSLFGDADR